MLALRVILLATVILLTFGCGGNSSESPAATRTPPAARETVSGIAPGSQAEEAATYLDQLQGQLDESTELLSVFRDAEVEWTPAAEQLKRVSEEMLTLVAPSCLERTDRFIKLAAQAQISGAENIIQGETLGDGSYIAASVENLQSANGYKQIAIDSIDLEAC